jgi:hypothetical protein
MEVMEVRLATSVVDAGGLFEASATESKGLQQIQVKRFTSA